MLRWLTPAPAFTPAKFQLPCIKQTSGVCAPARLCVHTHWHTCTLEILLREVGLLFKKKNNFFLQIPKSRKVIVKENSKQYKLFNLEMQSSLQTTTQKYPPLSQPTHPLHFICIIRILSSFPPSLPPLSYPPSPSSSPHPPLKYQGCEGLSCALQDF